MRKDKREYRCAIDATIDLVGGKYKPLILWYLSDETLRFNELSKAIPQATAKMLTQQLRELEADHLINRVVYPVVPPKVEYSLSEFGKSAIPVLQCMSTWGNRYLHEVKEETI